MVKKILLSMLMIICSGVVSSAPGAHIFSKKARSAGNSYTWQNDKKAVAEFTLKALASRDAAMLWQVFEPKVREMAIQELGNAEKAKSEMQKLFSADQHKELFVKLKKIYNDPQTRKKLIDTICDSPDALLQIDGKWYISPDGFGNIMARIRKMPDEIDQSSKEAVCESFAEAFINKDMDKFWLILPPALRQKALQENNHDEAAIKKQLADVFMLNMSEDTLQQVKTLMSKPETRKQYINNLVQYANTKKAFVYSNGKWYIDTTKFND